MTQEACKSLVLATLRRAELTEEERRTAIIVATGIRDSEIAMIGRPTALLGELLACERVLTGGTATVEQRDAAAQILIRSMHRPHRILAAEHMRGRADLPMWVAA